MQIIDGIDLIQESELEDSNNIYSIDGKEIKNRNIKIENNKLIITVENAPKFKLTKKDEETKSLLPNAKFRVSNFNDNKVLGIDGREIGRNETTNINNWTSTTTYKWTENEDGIYKSGNQSVKSTTSTIKFDFKLNAPGTLSFDWSVSSQDSSDYLYYYIINKGAGTTTGGSSTKISGTSRGTVYEDLIFENKEISLPAGEYTLQFNYYKDSKTNVGLDTGYVKNIRCVIDSIVETDSHGEVTINLGKGLYKLIEIEAPEGYDLPNNIEDRTYTFGIDETNSEYVVNWDFTKTDSENDNKSEIIEVFENSSGYIVFEQTGTLVGNGNISKESGESSFVKYELDKNGKLLKTTPIEGDTIGFSNSALMCYDESEDAYYYVCGAEFGKIKDNKKINIYMGGPGVYYYSDILVIGDNIYVCSSNESYTSSYLCRITKTGSMDKCISISYNSTPYHGGCGGITKYDEDKIAFVDLFGNITIYDLNLNELQKIEVYPEIEGFQYGSFSAEFMGKIVYYKGNFYLFNERNVFKIDSNGKLLWKQNYSNNSGRWLRGIPYQMAIPVSFYNDQLITADVNDNKINIYDLSGNLIYTKKLEEDLRCGMAYGSWASQITGIKKVSDTEFLTYGSEGYNINGALYDHTFEVTTQDVQEITVNNQLKQYNITTEIGINSENERTGGTITGEYNDTYLENKNIKFVENVKHGSNNTVNIITTPSENYSVVKVTINGKDVNFITDKNGVVTLPSGYFENVTEDKHIVVTFERGMSSILVHHYLKDSSGKYTAISVADDEYYTGRVDDGYTTSPKMNLQDYTLEKDTKDEYVIPTNASGKYTQRQQVINYYYEEKPVSLIVHHYLEGTETKLDDDIIESHEKGYNYQTKTSEEVLKNYEFVNVDGEETGTLKEDTIVTYYYRLKEHTITTQVQKHKEVRTDKILNEKVELEVLGGSVTGEYNVKYTESNEIKFVESVKQKENSKIEIVATPDYGYKVKTINLISTTDKGIKTENIIYGENAVQDAEITYTENADKSISLTTFTGVVEDKHIIVEFVPIESTVIVHHIIRGQADDYQTQTKRDLIGESYESGKIEIPGYKLVETSDNTSGVYVEDVTNVYYYYDKDSFEYIIEHYYEDKESHEYNKDDTATVYQTAKYQDVINITDNDKKLKTGYEYERQVGSPLTITEVVDNNVIKLYYGLADYGYRIEHYYENKETGEYLIDNEATENKIAEYQDIIETSDADKKLKTGYEYERQEGSPMIITEVIENNVIKLYYGLADYGYRIEHYYEDKESHEYVIDEKATEKSEAEYQDVIEITDTDKKLKIGYEYERQEGAPLTVTEVVDNNVIKLYYGLADYEYIVEYYYEDKETHEYEQDTSKTEHLEAEYHDVINSYEDKVKPGYKFDKTENKPLTITEIVENNVIKVYYGLADYSYTVEYYYENKETHEYDKDEDFTESFEAEYKDVIKEYKDKVKPGYEFDKTEKLPLTITEISENNVIKVYYGLANYSYTVEYYYENKVNHQYELDESLTDSFEAEYKDVITKYKDKVKPGYEFDKNENLPLTVTELVENNVIKVYYGLADYSYTVEYYYDEVKDESLTEKSEAEYQDKITTYIDKLKEGYALEKTENLPLTITEDPEDNLIKIYYRRQFKITTDVIEHTETYKDGTIKQSIKGGEISGEDLAPYEKVFKGDKPVNTIKMTPTKTNDEEYEIVKVVIKENKEDETGTEVNLENVQIQEDGSIILPAEYLSDSKLGMQSNKHVEVEFRKKTKVIVKYLEKDTEKVLAAEETIFGYETKEFETERKVVAYYQTSDLGITDENKVAKEPNGTMFADTITVIYWYERIPSGIVIKHIEINEQDKKEGLTLESGIILDSETKDGFVSLKENTTRNIYEGYISTDGPESDGSNIIIISAKDNKKEATYVEDEVVEVRYYYEKQYKITTEVKPHNEKDSKGNVVSVKGGSISGEELTPYEVVLKRGTSQNVIEMAPESGYRIKEIKINNKVYKAKELDEDKNYKVILPVQYFKDVQEDKHVIVEYEKIPAKVIVEYKDVDTKEKIIPDKEISGFVYDEYDEQRVEIESYIPANPEPENAKGTMTEEETKVTYWYTKEFKITTDVKEHDEVKKEETDEEEKIVSVKGGEISGEDENPYEMVARGKTSTKEIIMKPEDGYRIKEVIINEKTIEIAELVKEDKTIELPFFEDMQEDKHIVVEYEKIPAKVIIQYLEEGTEKPVSEEEIKEGYVNDKYITEPKEIPYYEFVEEKYPENNEGTMTEEDTIVKYYYKKLLFNMKIEKEIDKILLNGQNVEVTDKNKAKVEIKYINIKETELEVSYKIKVTNTEKVEGKAIIEEVLPEGFEFIAGESNASWKELDGKYTLETSIIEPGETIEYRVTLKWNPEEVNKGEKINIAKIAETNNTPDYKETTLEDNEDTAIIEVELNKTIEDIINDIKEDIVNMPKTGQTRIVYVLAVVICATCIGVIIWRKRRGPKNRMKL